MNKSFHLGELFESAAGDVDLQKKDIDGKGQFLINSGVDNRGIKGRTDREARVFPANTITVDFWGNAYYRDFDYKMATHNHVFSLSGAVIKDERVGLYLETLLSKLPEMFSYNNMATWNKLKSIKIDLPVIESSDPDHEYTVDDIDYQYMRDRIAELEQKRIAELEQLRVAELDALLQVAGLNDFSLTNEDRNTLNQDAEKKKFKIKDIFKKVYAKCKKENFDKRKDTSTVPSKEFSIPLVNAKFGDNGIMFYGREEDWNIQEMCIDVVQNGAVATGSVYAQPQHVGVLWDAYLIKPVFQVDSVEPLLYMAKCIEKITKEQFSYDKKATWDRVKLCDINLPVDSDGNIDVGYMERYIRAIEKLAIADVAKYRNDEIAVAKQIVGQQVA